MNDPDSDELLQRLRRFHSDTLHGWYYVMDGEIHVFDVQQGDFVPASVASNAGTGPYLTYVEHDGQILA
jgi:carbonic anhydrase